MISTSSRWLTYVLALLYGTLGLALFFLPEGMAPVFAWNISPFVAMTMGGWCLGNAWAAFVAARRWRWGHVYPILIYIWFFGLLELLVVVLFRDKLRLGHPIAWLYLVTLVVNVIAAVWGVIDWARRRPPSQAAGQATTPLLRLLLVLFVVFVGFLGVYGLVAQPGWPGTNGGIFPEVLSPFTLRSFGAFYLSLALATLFPINAKFAAPILSFGYAEMGLIIIITLAALRYLGLFDFANRPGGLAYIGVYVVVGVITLALLARYGTGNER